MGVILQLLLGVVVVSVFVSTVSLIALKSRRAAKWTSILVTTAAPPLLLLATFTAIFVGYETPGGGGFALAFALWLSAIWLMAAAVLTPFVFWTLEALPIFSRSEPE